MTIDNKVAGRLPKKDLLVLLSVWCDWLEESGHALADEVRGILSEELTPFVDTSRFTFSWWLASAYPLDYVGRVKEEVFRKLGKGTISYSNRQVKYYGDITDAYLRLARARTKARVKA